MTSIDGKTITNLFVRSLKRFGWSGDITIWRSLRSFEKRLGYESTSPYADLRKAFLLPRIQKHRILESLNRRFIMELSSTQLEQVIDLIENDELAITKIAEMLGVSEDVVAIAYEAIFG